jgi:hypothetical protein
MTHNATFCPVSHTSAFYSETTINRITDLEMLENFAFQQVEEEKLKFSNDAVHYLLLSNSVEAALNERLSDGDRQTCSRHL